MSWGDIGIIASMIFVCGAFVYTALMFSRLVGKSEKTGDVTRQILVILNFFQRSIKDIVGEQWTLVYESVRKSLLAVVDGELSHDEAVNIAKDVFNTALGFTNVQLTDAQRNFIYNIIEAAVEMVIMDKESSNRALMLSRLP